MRDPGTLAGQHDAVAAGRVVDLLHDRARHVEGQEIEEHAHVGLVGKCFPDGCLRRGQTGEDEQPQGQRKQLAPREFRRHRHLHCSRARIRTKLGLGLISCYRTRYLALTFSGLGAEARMRNGRRVVITGIGVVAPNGIGKQAYWDSLVSGKSGVDWITEFDTDPYPCKVAAKVQDFNPGDFVSSKQARHMGRFSQFAVAACRMALEDSGLAYTRLVAKEATVCFGTSGGAPIFEKAAVDFQLGGMKAVDPWTALEYPPHAPASYVSIELGITGPTISVSSNCCTGLDALQTAALQVRS